MIGLVRRIAFAEVVGFSAVEWSHSRAQALRGESEVMLIERGEPGHGSVARCGWGSGAAG